MLAELLFIVDLLQRRGLHQTSGRTFDFWRGKPRASQSQQNVVTVVAKPTPITLTMPVDIGAVDPITAAKDFVASGTGRPESMKEKMKTGRF